MEQRGIFIAIEGGEGSGKSTHLGRLKEMLPAQYSSRDFVFTREPGGSLLADEIRKVMIAEGSSKASGRTMLGLIMASRSDHVENTIMPALAQGKVVVSDRFLASSYAYQVMAQESPELEDIFWAYAKTFPVPNRYLFLNVSPEVARLRVESRESRSHFHSRTLAFHERVREGYRQYFKQSGVPCIRIDAGQDLGAVWRDVEKAVQSILK